MWPCLRSEIHHAIVAPWNPMMSSGENELAVWHWKSSAILPVSPRQALRTVFDDEVEKYVSNAQRLLWWLLESNWATKPHKNLQILFFWTCLYMGKHGKVCFLFLELDLSCAQSRIAILFLRRNLHRRSAFAVPKGSKSASYPRAWPEVWQASEFMRHRKARRVRSMALSENWAPKIPSTDQSWVSHSIPLFIVSGCTGFALVTDVTVFLFHPAGWARSRSTSRNAWSMVFGRSSNRSHGSEWLGPRGFPWISSIYLGLSGQASPMVLWFIIIFPFHVSWHSQTHPFDGDCHHPLFIDGTPH